MERVCEQALSSESKCKIFTSASAAWSKAPAQTGGVNENQREAAAGPAKGFANTVCRQADRQAAALWSFLISFWIVGDQI